jgi:iron complex outermembrane receptor protein
MAIMSCQAAYGQATRQNAMLDTVIVEEEQLDGSAKGGYIVNQPKETGPWTEKKLLDTPYAVESVTSEFIENIQAQHPADIFKTLPHVLSSHQYVNIYSNFSARGMWGGGGRNIVNGIINHNNGLGIFVEDIESMEVLTGLSGFMYGTGNVGGLVNYNIKRPTFEFMNKLKIGYIEGQAFTHLDSGGPIIKDKLAYRLNLVYQDGDTPIEHQSKKKTLVSGSLNWKILDNLDLLLFGSYGEYELLGRQTVFNRLSNYLGPPLDGSKLWTSDDSFHKLYSVNYGLSLKYIINEHVKFRFGYMHSEADRTTLSTAAQFLPNRRTYNFNATAMNWDYHSDGISTYLDFDFDTFSIHHKLTVGFNGYDYSRYDGRFCNPTTGVCQNTMAASALIPFFPAGTIPAGGNFPGSFSNPSIANRANLKALNYFNYYNGSYHTQDERSYNFIIGDDIKFNDKFELLLGLNLTKFETKAYSITTGALTGSTKVSNVTPTVSFIFKPIPAITTYATYMESLEPPTVVSNSGTQTYLNAGDILDSARSKQYELGVKANLWNILFTAALFQIERDTNINVDTAAGTMMLQDGFNRYRGLELAARGRIADSLNIMTGLTLMNSVRKKTTRGIYDGVEPTFTPKILAKLYLEYEVPFIDGLNIIGGLYHTGSAYATDNHVLEIPALTLADAGLRYSTKLFDRDIIFRFDVTNVADKSYWGFTSGEVAIGAPRTFRFSTEYVF